MKKLNRQQFSVLTAPFLHHTLEFGLDAIAANGFQKVELWGASPHYCMDDYTPEERAMRIRKIRQMLRDRGLSLSVFHPEQCRQYPINIASPIAYVRRRSMDAMYAYLEDTLDFGTDKMILAPGWPYVDDKSEDGFRRSVESIQKLDERARSLGVKLLMEEMGATATLFLRDKAHLQTMLSAVGSDNIGVCLDTVLAAGNAPDTNVAESYYETFGSVEHVHFADAGAEGYAALGTGSADLTAQLAALAAQGYEGDISVCLWGADFFKDPDAGMRQTADWLREHL